jgi:hypothetical protein
LLSHHEECAFAPVQRSHDGCEETVNRQDLVSHQQNCEFRSVTCENCHEAMRQTDSCVLLKKIDDNRQAVTAVQWILEEMQQEQLRHDTEIQRLARELQRKAHAKLKQEDVATRQVT